MKPRQMIAACVFAILGLGAMCRPTARTVLDVAEAACILFHDDIEDEVALARACGIGEALLPELRMILSARKSAKAQKAAMGAPSSSPVPAPSSSK